MTDSDASPGDSADPEADLLDFIPVVRKIKRPDGWTPELQRDYIRRLAISGSPQQVCTEMGKHVTGIEALYKVPGADSFRAAWDEAVRIGRTAQGLDCGPPHLGPVPGINRRPPRNAASSVSDFAPEDEEPEIDDVTKAALFNNITRKYMLKVGHEREARLGGRIVEADFTLRQITCIEIALDLAARRLGTSGWEVIREARMGEHNIFDIAETDLSRFLDEARRAVWAETGEPDRPEHPPKRYLVRHAQSSRGDDEHGSHDGYCTEPTEYLRGGDEADREAQIAAREEQYREDAKAQIAYENAAREAWAARREQGEDN